MKTSEHIVEEWLVINCQRGDRKALELLIKRWHPKLIRRIYHTTQDSIASQDIAQDTWITIIKKIKSLRDPRSFEWWSLKIATIKAIDWIRANQLSRRRDEIRKIAQKDFADSSLVDYREEVLSSLRLGIQQLSEEQQQVVRMFYRENLSVLTIGQILDLPSGTVKTRLFKARKRLKKFLENKIIES